MSDVTSEPTFDQLMQHYEMGQAYVAITEAMGPSAQLLAFVNYQRLNDEAPEGLESFTLENQHQMILDEIAADSSLEMALQILTNEIIVHVGKEDFVGTEGFLSKIFGAKIAPYGLFKHLKAYHEINVVCEKNIIDHIPSGFGLKEWNHYFESVCQPSWKKFNQESIELTREANQFNTDYGDTNFDDSGWNKANYEDSKVWLDKKNKEADALIKKNKEKLDKVKAFVEKDAKTAPDGKAVVKLIRSCIHSDPGSDNLRYFLSGCERILSKVAKKIK